MCDACGQVDDHPRHVFANADGDGVTNPEVAATAIKAADPADLPAIIAQVQDNSTVMRHMDCCRNAGCPDGACNTVTVGAESKTGSALVKHLTKEG
jgi:hypothetical protein